jgi:hypothetical protein
MRDSQRSRPGRTVARSIGAIVLTAGGVLASVSTAQAAQIDIKASYQGCDEGYACIYPNASWNNGVIEHGYYTYGVHQLYNEYNVHRVFNNQTGGATIRLCVNRDGTNCTSKILPWNFTDINLTPYNSIRLDPS